MVEFMTVTERNRIAEAITRIQPLLPAASIDGATNGRISYQQLSDGLTVRISFFEGRQVGARFHVLINSQVPENTWGVGGVVEKPDGDILVTVPPDRALQFRGQKVSLLYFYFDAEEPTSPSTEYFVESDIYPPIVDESRDGSIPLDAVKRGVNLRLRASDALSPGALVSAFWIGSGDATLVRHLQIDVDQANEDVVLFIDPQYLTPNKYGEVQIIYTAETASRKYVSSLVELKIEGDFPMPEPMYGSLPAMVPGEFMLIDESGRIPFRQSTRGMEVNDTVTFVFTAYKDRTEYVLRQTLGPHQIGNDLLIRVPVGFGEIGFGTKMVTVVERASGETFASPVVRMTLPPNPD